MYIEIKILDNEKDNAVAVCTSHPLSKFAAELTDMLFNVYVTEPIED